jgi:hypothetical protein
MIRKQSDDPDVAEAAREAHKIIKRILNDLPKADTFDYGGHILSINDYGMCNDCTRAIAEAQQASMHLLSEAEQTENPTVKEHLELAAEMFRLEAEASKIRAEFHNGKNTEPILNDLLGFIYDKGIHDDFHHSHHGDK